MKLRSRWHICLFVAFLVILIQYFGYGPGSRLWWTEPTKEQRFPLVWKQMQNPSKGGVWHIPESWLPSDADQPDNIVEAAVLAAAIAEKEPHRYISNTRIPRIIHQTWKSTDIEGIPDVDLTGMEAWLRYATGADGHESAYMFWDDDGAMDLMRKFEPEAMQFINLLPSPVEKADAFRVIVCNTIGGVYGDIDTTPLRNPATWIEPSDISSWTDEQTGQSFGHSTTTGVAEGDSNGPVGLILGIEADTPEDSDSFWRQGYEYPVQLTQWALAGAKSEPVLNLYVHNLQNDIWNASQEARASGKITTGGVLQHVSAVSLTGPVAVTKAAKEYMSEKYDLRWQALSGLEDGGRSKLVGSTLILPITGFSPGRGRRANMGSRPITHHDARLQHNFQGSWKKFDLKVEMGKACRTLLGACRDWSKVPS